MSFSLPSYAKINWTLRILGKREDGFHELRTVYQTISLHDKIAFRESRELRLSCYQPGMPTDERNLIMKAAMNLRAATGVELGADIRLTKRIPTRGGLGGGSSNAAVALIGLRRLWNLDITDIELAEIANEIGSDVPLFLEGGTCLGTGRGEVVESLDDLIEPFCLIVCPRKGVSTRDAFSRLNAVTLTKEGGNRILPVCRNEAESLDLRHSVLINDFETSVFDARPEIKRVKETLLELGAVNAAMSGSGASVFAIFDKTETRQTAMKALDKESTWRKFAVSTVSRSEYREALGL